MSNWLFAGHQVKEMEGFIIALSIAFSIFFIVSTVVLIRRKQKAKQNVGYVISEGTPVTVTSTSHASPGGAPVTHYPPPGYQTNVYPGTYAYPAQTTSHEQVQMQGMQGYPTPGIPVSYLPLQQRAMDASITMSGVEPSVLPANLEKQSDRQSHQGAVETVSQI